MVNPTDRLPSGSTNPVGRNAPLPAARSRQMAATGSALADELVDAAVLRQAGVDVAARVDADAVDMAAREAGQHMALAVADADLRRLAVVFLLGDVEIAVLAAADVVGAAHAGPLALEVALRREDLDALVGPVGDVEEAGIVEGDAVRQVELARPVARRAPRFNEPPALG